MNQATTDHPTTTTRALTTRSVLYVGYPCNIKCQFCYYAHNPDRRWRSLEETSRDADAFRRFGHDRVDITGGEPTVYPHVLGLISHCREIGLRPTLITNTQVLADLDRAKKFKDAGIYDFLCSVHAIGESYNEIICRKSGWANVETAIDNLNALEIPWRANCTLTRNVIPQLADVVEFVAARGGRVLNFISFNSFYEWEHETEGPGVKFQTRHSEIRDALHAALDACDRHGIEANVRYMPLCFLRGHEEKCYNFHQMPYDSHEWGFDTWCFAERGLFEPRTRFFWQHGVANAMRLAGHVVGRARVTRLWAVKNRRALYRKGEPCHGCSMRRICDGLTRQYAARFGFEELEPFDGPVVSDPLHFISRQEKLVD